MASKIIAFSPTPLPSTHHSTPSGNSLRPFSVVFTARNPTVLSVVRAHSTGENNTSLDLHLTNNHATVEPRQPRRRWALDAAPSGKSSSEKWEEEGLITESLPDGKFLVKLDNGDSILGYLSGKIRQRFIRVMPGDRVKIEFSRYDLSKGRITYRLRNKDRIIETEE